GLAPSPAQGEAAGCPAPTYHREMPQRAIVPALFQPPGHAHYTLVEAGTALVLTAGAVPLDTSGVLVGEGDLQAQTRQVITNLEIALRAAASGLEHARSSTVYVVSPHQ